MTVYLVGAGPGDPGLVTLRAAELLERAEVVVYDRLVDPRVLSMAPRARLVDVGKHSGNGVSSPSQAEINAVLVEVGRDSQLVVRLKGGDPYVLGRGGEEALALASAGIDYEVVPGISSAIAVASYAGVPVTHRGAAPGFIVVNGHDAAEAVPSADWAALAASRCTIVVLMGASTSDMVARRLLEGGLDTSTPVLVVENGTTPAQRSRRATLAGLARLEVSSPATIVVGEVAALGLASFEQRALFGWRVVVTRPASAGAAMAAALGAAGALPVELPVVEIVAPPDGGAALREAAGHLASYAWIVCTSANAVDRLFAEVHDARALGAAKVAAVGPATAAALRRHGVVADLVPEHALGAALVEAFPAPGPKVVGGRVLLPRAVAAPDVVPAGLAALGWSVEVVDAYATVRRGVDEGALERVASADAVTFASPSAVSAFLSAAGARRLPPVVATIGPVTSAAARDAGLAVHVEAAEPSPAGIVDALSAYARRGAAAKR